MERFGEPERRLWQRVLALGAGRVSDQNLRRLATAFDQIPLTDLTAEGADVRAGVRTWARDLGISPGGMHSLDQALMGLVRRAALLGMLPPPAEGPWNSTWQAAIDAAPAGAKASLKALAGWSHSKGMPPESVTDETLVRWRDECRRSPTEAARLSKILLDRNRASVRAGADLLSRLKLRKAQGTTRDIYEQYGIKSEKVRSPMASSTSK